MQSPIDLGPAKGVGHEKQVALSKRVEAAFWDLHRFDQDGRIVESWSLMDRAGIMEQISRYIGERK